MIPTTPFDADHFKLLLGMANYDAANATNEELAIQWCLRRLDYLRSREQELEAQNKALWELVGICERALIWFNANAPEKDRWVSQEPIVAIQKAKESKV